jgi:hypothetical protein
MTNNNQLIEDVEGYLKDRECHQNLYDSYKGDELLQQALDALKAQQANEEWNERRRKVQETIQAMKSGGERE